MDVNKDGTIDRDEFRAAVDRGDLEGLLSPHTDNNKAGRRGSVAEKARATHTAAHNPIAAPLRSLVSRLDRVIADHDVKKTPF